MSLRVWKYPLPSVNVNEILMPRGMANRPARILHLEAQHDVPCLWALVDDQGLIETRMFFVVGTGHPFPEIAGPFEYVGSYQLFRETATPFVGHVFEVLHA